MKLLLTLLLLPSLAMATQHNWFGSNDSTTAGQQYNQNVNLTVSPGDTINVNGYYTLINWRNVNGTAANPILIRVLDYFRVGVNTSNGYGMLVEGRYWKFVGTDTNRCLIYNPTRIQTNNFIVGASKNYTIKNLKMRYAQAALFGNPTTGGNMGSPLIENVSISMTRRLDGVTAEGMYLGPTSNVDTSAVYWQNGIIRNCVLYDLAGDGIQVALWRNVTIENCKIYNYGLDTLPNQRSGIIIGGSSSGTVKNCIVDGGTGYYFQTYGYGQVTVQNCTFINGAMIQPRSGETGGPDGMYLQKNGNATFPLYVTIENTVIGQALRNAIRETNATLVTLCNVTMNSDGPNLSGDVFTTTTNCVVTPPPPDPVEPKKPTNPVRPKKTATPVKLRKTQ